MSCHFYQTDIYHPPSKALDLYIEQHALNKFKVDFYGSECRRDLILAKLADMSCDVIARMPEAYQERESERFFVYLLQDPRLDLRSYLRPLLDYFHVLGFLKFKKHVYNKGW